MSGALIVFEGTEGAGKSEQLRLLERRLRKLGYDVEVTEEPTSSPIGGLIHKVLYGDARASDEALALLFAADRSDHTRRVIEPALKRGAVVLCDRYTFSSLAYQGGGMRTTLDLGWLRSINRFALEADLVFFLDVEPEVGLGRIRRKQRRIQDDEYFESVKKQELIREMYYEIFNFKRSVGDLRLYEGTGGGRQKTLDASKINNTLVLKIDASDTVENVHDKIFDHTLSILKSKHVGKKRPSSVPAQKLMTFTEDR